MAKANICYHNFRLNLDNEQHKRVHWTLAKLNTEIHKSVNQFIVNAVDFYIHSLSDENFMKDMNKQKEKEKVEYLTKDSLKGIQDEMMNEMKNEVIMLLGAALGAGTARAAEEMIRNNNREAMPSEAKITYEEKEMITDAKDAVDPTISELVDNWG